MHHAIWPAFLVVLTVLRVELMGHEDDSVSQLVSRSTESIEDVHVVNLICTVVTLALAVLCVTYDVLRLHGCIDFLGPTNLNLITQSIMKLTDTTLLSVRFIRLLYIAFTCHIFYLTWVAVMTISLGVLGVAVCDLINPNSTLRLWFRVDRTLVGLAPIFLHYLSSIVWCGMLFQTWVDAYLGEARAAERRYQARLLKEN